MKLIKLKSTNFRIFTALLCLLLVLPFVWPFLTPRASALALTYDEVLFNNMDTSAYTAGTVCAKPASSGTETSVKVTFPTGYTVSSTVGNWAVSTSTTTSWPKDPANGTTAATAWPGISAPTGSGEFVISGQSVNFGSSAVTAGTWYCFNWTNSTAALQQPSGAGNNETGSVVTQTTGGVALDTGNYATSTLTNDQIAVTATVNPNFSFSLSGNSAGLGTLSTSSPTAATAINAQVSTNATAGWDMWAYDPDTTPGLTSVSAAHTIAYSPSVGSTSAALSNGVEGYNLGAGTASGTTCTSVTDNANFASGGTSYKGGGLDGTPRSLAVSTGVANACSLPLTVNASISNITPAGNDYAGIMTIVAAGQF